MKKNVLLCLLSAILLILSFPKPNLGFLAWFSLVPWLFALQKQSPKPAFFLSYLVGLVFFSGILYWVNYVSSLGFTVLVLYLALYFALFGLFFSATNNLLIIPCLWVSLEYIRSHLFSGFAWALLGYSQYRNLPFIQISDISGAYGVSFLIVLVNAGIFQMISSRKKKYLFYILLPLILALSYGYLRLNQKPEGQNVKIATIQGNIPQIMKWNPDARGYILERYFHLTEEALPNQPDLIIWPETSVPGYLENDPGLLAEVFSLSKKVFPAYLLVGTPHEGEDRKTYNSATLLLQGKVIRRYDKLHLVPFGEFIPAAAIFSRFSFAGLIGNFTPGEDYTIFNFSKGGQKINFSALICFEDVFPHLVRRFAQKGAHLLVNMTNDAWFGDSSEPEQHLQASVFRAVENRVNLVRSANTGISCFINPRGKILSRVSDYSGRDVLVEGEKTENLNIASMSSFYRSYGDIFALLCLIGSGLGLLRRKKL